MATVHLRKILNYHGINSVRELISRTGSQERSVFKQGQIAAIDALYQKNRGFRGPFGFPLTEVEFNGSYATRSYSGGPIHFLNNTPQGEGEMTIVRVRYVGFHCISESTSDQLSGSDEPYFIISVVGANGSKTQLFGPYADIDTGSVKYEATYIVSEDQQITPPIVLSVVAMEHDEGTPEEAEAKVREIVLEVERKFDQAVSALSGVATDNHVMPEWARDILIGWVPEGIAAIFGLGDDEIGKTPVVLFDNKAELKEWRAPSVKGIHGQNEYNVEVPVDGGDEGNYNHFFLVTLHKYRITIMPF